MTKFQTTIHALRDEIATGIVEDAADQPEVRWTVNPTATRLPSSLKRAS